MADKKLLFILFSWSLLWIMMAGRIPGAHSVRLLQSAHATLYGRPDASVTIATFPKLPAPTPAPITNDDKKEDTKAENDSKLLITCGDPCCGTNYHGPCSRCCRKGPPDINDHQNPEKAANGGGGVGLVGGWT